MKLGSGEHYGWDRPRTVVFVDVRDGVELECEFARLRVPAGAKGGPLEVMVRLRVGRIEPWRAPDPGERIEVQAWQIDEDQAELLDLETELGEAGRWTPPQRNPDLWLWVEG
ncbi:hypothetical protein IWX78_002300 [Mycetocola sp. CAN_C7]|uniref:hypothetical protein n=1 Tax=Mycetocola sp. CAN_C7 TaxID=2787724 RepID=UPI0018CAB94B